MNLPRGGRKKRHETRERLATCGRVLEVKWMKTVFADVKLRVLGELRASTIGDEWYNVSVNYRRGEGPSRVCVCAGERLWVIFWLVVFWFCFFKSDIYIRGARRSSHSKALWVFLFVCLGFFHVQEKIIIVIIRRR